MIRPVLVDSSWYITELKTGRQPLRQLHLLALSRDIAVTGLVKTEVGRGLQHPKVLEKFRRAWDVMLYVDSDWAMWDATLALSWQLDRRGINLPLQDIHIACCAKKIGAVILTYDKHFQRMPGVDSTDRIY